MASENGSGKFEFLRQLAIEGGVVGVQIIPASKIVIEDRVVLKCKIGCKHYGKSLACPPFTPTAAEFRKIVSEYRYAMLMKFGLNSKIDSGVTGNLSQATDPSVPVEIRKKIEEFWSAWNADKRKILELVVSLEKAALKKGYPLAVAFVTGACQLCEKCNTESRICTHPELARWSDEAVGINIQKTANNAGISVTFPFEKDPASFALLLID